MRKLMCPKCRRLTQMQKDTEGRCFCPGCGVIYSRHYPFGVGLSLLLASVVFWFTLPDMLVDVFGGLIRSFLHMEITQQFTLFLRTVGRIVPAGMAVVGLPASLWGLYLRLKLGSFTLLKPGQGQWSGPSDVPRVS